MRTLFPSAQKIIHLNHAGVSPIARPVADAVAALTTKLAEANPIDAFIDYMQRQEHLRSALGRMMKTDPRSLCFVKNTSHGLAIAAQALPLQPGDVIVVAANEYPSNQYPWMAQAHRGARVRSVPPREDGYVAEEDLIAACRESPQTRVLAVSWVQWGNGQRMDLAQLGAFCRERDIYLVVDVVQGLGALRFDIEALPWVDFAAAGSHKWLMTPAGAGVLYIKPERMAELLPTNIGSNAVNNPMDWERLHFDDLKAGADRFEEGTPNILPIAALDASITLLESVGFDAVEARVLEIADLIRKELAARGHRVISPAGPGQRSGIVSFRHSTLSNEAALAALQAGGVTAAVRCGNVRLSPHVYNTEAEIEAALSVL